MFKKMLFCAAAGLLLLAQSACDNDKPQPTPSAQKGSTLITTTVVNPDGASGVCYMQLIDGLTGHYDNAKAVPAGFGAPPVSRRLCAARLYGQQQGGDAPLCL